MDCKIIFHIDINGTSHYTLSAKDL
jgi:hypothetical protein